MNAVQSEQPPTVEQPSPTPLLRTVVLCDLVDSTTLIAQLGDRDSATFMHRLDRECRNLLAQHGGREIDKTDGFLFLFERPIQAVAFALDYQRLIWEFGQSEFLPLSARVGIHVGDVVLWQNSPDDIARGAKPLELEGLIKPVAARLMNLALPGQILVSGIAHTLAIRAHNELPTQPPAQWRKHGRYLMKGLAEPTAVYEVGHADIAPLQRPAWSGKAWREVPWWRRPGMLAIEAAVAVAAIAVPIYLSVRSPPAIAFGQRDWVVVGDLNNLTGKPILDESLENAFRLGLEQSQYVNVLSALKTRDTVELMQRDPAKARVDRAVGSEVAIRAGARALILPTVAEVGGMVRVSAEVIDPKTQTTVYTESVDGRDIRSVLPSIDKIDRNLRLRLGEALASVSKQSRPLDQVATANLDALRAYSLGQRAYFTGNMKDALDYYEDAVKLDPKFATAHLVIARALLNGGNNSAALKQISLALAESTRLSARDAMLADAWQSTLTSPSAGLQKWKLLTNLYPDYYLANGPYSYYAWCENHYVEAIAAGKLNVSPKNAYSSAGLYLLGIVYLAQDRYSDSETEFKRAADSGFARNDFYAELFSAQRKYRRAEQLLNENKPSGVKSDDLGTQIVRIAIAADQGSWTDAKALIDKVKTDAASLGGLSRRRLQGVELGLRSQFAEVSPRELTQYAEEALSQKTDNALDSGQLHFQALFAAYLLARGGDTRSAAQLLTRVNIAVAAEENSTIRNLQWIVKAELKRSDGHADQAIALLRPLIDGHELYLTHLALLDAYSSNRQNKDALDESQWLSSHRGRAYAEYGGEQFLTAFNVIQSDLALLRAAELTRDLENTHESNEALAKFEQVWPQWNKTNAIALRVRAVRSPN